MLKYVFSEIKYSVQIFLAILTYKCYYLCADFFFKGANAMHVLFNDMFSDVVSCGIMLLVIWLRTTQVRGNLLLLWLNLRNVEKGREREKGWEKGGRRKGGRKKGRKSKVDGR